MSKTIFSTCAALTALLISGASVARPQQGLIVHKALSLDMAMAMTQGSLAKCREMHYKCAVTVLDATGRTMIALQDDGANLAGPATLDRFGRGHAPRQVIRGFDVDAPLLQFGGEQIDAR